MTLNGPLCLWIEKSINIEASPEKVWHVLTSPEGIKTWAAAFDPGTYAESDWQVGSKVTWRNEKDPSAIINQGTVTMLTYAQLLMVDFGENTGRQDDEPACTYSETYTLTKKEIVTVLAVKVGGISQKYFDEHSPHWEKALEIIKAEAEK